MSAGEGGVTEDLAKTLRDRGVTDVYVAGLAGDYCVKSTALDAAKAKFAVALIEDVQRCVDPSAWDDVVSELQAASVSLQKLDTLSL